MYTVDSPTSAQPYTATLEDVQSPRDVELLVLAVQKLSIARSVQAIADVVKHTARAMTHADGATFVLRDHGQCYYFDEDAIAPLWKGRRFPMEICVSGWAMHNRQPAIVENIVGDPRIPFQAYEPTFVKSLVMMPVRRLDPIAAIGIYWSVPHVATQAEVALLQALADSTAIAMENVQVYSELEERVEQRTQELATANDALRATNQQLQAALDHIQNLEEIVSMCAWTQRLEYNGEWVSVEDYLHRRFGLRVSHGISQEAMGQLREEMEAMKAQLAVQAPARQAA